MWESVDFPPPPPAACRLPPPAHPATLSRRLPPWPQVYTVTGGKNVPAWLSDKKKKALRKDEEYRRRIELIQDFEFPAGCNRIKVTPDGQFIFASGYHPPQVGPAGCWAMFSGCWH